LNNRLEHLRMSLVCLGLIAVGLAAHADGFPLALLVYLNLGYHEVAHEGFF
jgi:hypothetical protein